MSDTDIVPPVAEDVLAQYKTTVAAAAKTLEANGTDVAKDVSALKAFWHGDKTAIVAALMHIAVLLVTAVYLHLPAKDVAVLGSIVAAGGAYFTTAINIVKSK